MANVNRDVWRTALAFVGVGGKWFISVWILSMLTGIIPLVFQLLDRSDPPDELMLGGFLFGFVVLPFVAFHLMRIQRDEFAVRLDPRGILVELGVLRKEGVEIRNDGKVFLSEASVDRWIERAVGWNSRVLARLNELDPAEASIFETLDIVTVQLPRGYQPFNPKHELHLRMLTQRTKHIKELVISWRPRQG